MEEPGSHYKSLWGRAIEGSHHFLLYLLTQRLHNACLTGNTQVMLGFSLGGFPSETASQGHRGLGMAALETLHMGATSLATEMTFHNKFASLPENNAIYHHQQEGMKVKAMSVCFNTIITMPIGFVNNTHIFVLETQFPVINNVTVIEFWGWE